MCIYMYIYMCVCVSVCMISARGKPSGATANNFITPLNSSIWLPPTVKQVPIRVVYCPFSHH